MTSSWIWPLLNLYLLISLCAILFLSLIHIFTSAGEGKSSPALVLSIPVAKCCRGT